MSKSKAKKIQSMGGKANSRRHRFTSEEARRAVLKRHNRNKQNPE